MDYYVREMFENNNELIEAKKEGQYTLVISDVRTDHLMTWSKITLETVLDVLNDAIKTSDLFVPEKHASLCKNSMFIKYEDWPVKKVIKFEIKYK